MPARSLLLLALSLLLWSPAGAASYYSGVRPNYSVAAGNAPTSVSVASDGGTITVNWPFAMVKGAGWGVEAVHLTIDGTNRGNDEGAIWTGSGSSTWTGILTDGTILQGAKADLDFDGTANSIEATSGGADLGAMLNFPIFNNSTQLGLASFSETFTGSNGTKPPNVNWTNIGTDNVEIQSNAASSPTTFDFDFRGSVYSGEPCATATQYVKATIDGPATGSGVGLVLRHTASGALYLIQFDADDDVVHWKYLPTPGGTAVTVESKAFSVTYPLTVGVVVTGTGSGTEIRVWRDPSTDVPGTINTWGGEAADEILDANPATAADSGPLVGLGINNTSSTTAATWDNLSGGDVP